MSRLNVLLDKDEDEYLKVESNLGDGLNFKHSLAVFNGSTTNNEEYEFSVMKREHLELLVNTIQKHLDETE